MIVCGGNIFQKKDIYTHLVHTDCIYLSNKIIIVSIDNRLELLLYDGNWISVKTETYIKLISFLNNYVDKAICGIVDIFPECKSKFLPSPINSAPINILSNTRMRHDWIYILSMDMFGTDYKIEEKELLVRDRDIPKIIHPFIQCLDEEELQDAKICCNQRSFKYPLDIDWIEEYILQYQHGINIINSSGQLVRYSDLPHTISILKTNDSYALI